MTCQRCGAQLPADVASCPTCGAPAAAAGGAAGTPAGTPAGASGAPGASGSGGAPPSAAGAGGYPSPAGHPSGLPSEVRNWAMAGHLSAFLGSFVALALLGPLVVWLVRREVDGFSEEHAREALNFNLTVFLLLIIGAVVSLLTFGLALIVVVPIGLGVAVTWIILTILAAVRASEGRAYRYPMTIRFVS